MLLAKVVLLAACLVVYPTVSFAEHTIPPPARYDYPNNSMIVIEGDNPGLFCKSVGARSPANRIMGCALQGKDWCAIVIPRKHPDKRAIYRHERAHCNGWPSHHPR